MLHGYCSQGLMCSYEIMCKILLDRADLARHMNMISEHCRNRYYLEYQSAFKIRELRRCHCDEESFSTEMIGCAKGIFAKGLLGGTWFSFFGWKKNSRIALIVQINPLSSVRTTTGKRPWDLDNEGNSGALSHPQRENQVPPKSPQRDPLSATNDERIFGISESL